MKKKVTERRFTPMMNMKHFVEKIADHGEKPVFNISIRREIYTRSLIPSFLPKRSQRQPALMRLDLPAERSLLPVRPLPNGS